ncbi:hypothetical protein ACFOY2_15245 [Nonomuraea purpurea]|uniref:Novel STAND NTPase 1 domain-containing protein n=1 Tax=Nonomuraea purpurea TaxID=1849276 RepID=A0ABV8G3J4_9ACTN
MLWSGLALPLGRVRTWHNRHDGRLTLHDYDRSGGVASAVQDAAEDVYRDLRPRKRACWSPVSRPTCVSAPALP